MLGLFSIMLNVIAPIFLVMGVAYGIGKRFNPDLRGLSIILIYLFVPALVFRGIYETELSAGEAGGIVAVSFGMALVMAAIGMAVARWLGWDTRRESALVLTIMMVNSANYGIPLNRFAFGEEGANTAIVFYVAAAIVGNTIGVYFASRGTYSAREAFLNVFRVPTGYAAILAVLFKVFGIEFGEVEALIFVERTIDIAADGSIPGMLALLGLNLAQTELRGEIRPIMTATGLRLLGGMAVGFALASLFQLRGVAFNVAVVESSMPTAVLASALATQFNADAKFVSAVTLVSTLLSMFTLAGLILFLGGGTV